MILVDANILLYAYDSDSASHAGAKKYLQERLSERPVVAFAWLSILAFLRIGTNPRLRQSPLSMAEASGHVRSWLTRRNVSVLEAGPRHWEILDGLLREAKVTGNLVSDAHLAALAIEHGANLITSDHDFARFPGLRWEDPLGTGTG